MQLQKLKTRWQTRLEKWYDQPVNCLITQNGVYAGYYGYILRLSASSGEEEAKSGLKGYGYHEVRLATNPQGTLLVAGTNGYVIGLDPLTLQIWWYKGLSGGSNPVSVLCDCNGVYAASNGYVFLLNTVGRQLKNNPLRGYGKHETRLAHMPSSPYLIVGINGYTVALDAKTLDNKWYNSMPGAGKDITTVIAGQGVVYGACNGRVYRIGETNGVLLQKNELSGTGSEEVRMALDTTSSRLYVGTNGYGLCLDANDLGELYKTSLPSSGYHVTDAAFGEQKVGYFACDGYVYQLDQSGEIAGENDLRDLGKFETRLATSSSGYLELIVGIAGYALGLEIVDRPLPVDYQGQTYSVAFQPVVYDIFDWRTYDPSTVPDVGILLGFYQGRLMGMGLTNRTVGPLPTNWDGTSYNYVFMPNGAIIYFWWPYDDRSQYFGHNELGSGDMVICAGQFRLAYDSRVESVIAMANNPSGWVPDGGACLQYVALKFNQLGISTDRTSWYWGKRDFGGGETRCGGERVSVIE
ncbi:hypothetical protein AJ79_01195 [Helicocarpus griseus UAMH5409]|uniref:Uncharacterized protein n=1 Tax=Helicocarpus griseus UAMH5409 TaxID=1447875 RepID=A0A2B7Y8C9_9EURO|nr:hypothetical protein AJ79_01195 [Helicocarpus griseus UAMH5409]